MDVTMTDEETRRELADETVGTVAAAASAGVSYRQLHHWIACGYIDAVEGPDGSGSRIRLTLDEVFVVRVMGRLVDAGFAPAQASLLARTLADDGRVEVGPDLTLVMGRVRDGV